MSTYQIKEVEFLTHMPENGYQGDPKINARLQRKWLEEKIDVDDDEPAYHLQRVLDYVENCSGMLVGYVALECTRSLHPETPSSIRADFPSLSMRYPKGWVWKRSAKLLNAHP